jgi:hypothetical protein
MYFVLLTVRFAYVAPFLLSAQASFLHIRSYYKQFVHKISVIHLHEQPLTSAKRETSAPHKVLPVSQASERRISNPLEGNCSGLINVLQRHLSGGAENPKKNFGDNNWCFRPLSNQAPPECKTTALPLC